MRRSRRSTDGMPVRRRLTDADDRGSASLEFLLAGMVLLVPLVYLVVALGVVQEQSLGIEAGARHAARSVATAPDGNVARARVDAVRASLADEYGVDPARLSVTVECPSSIGDCPQAGALVAVTLRTTVTLPLVPPVLGLDRLAALPIEATGVQNVSRAWTG